MEHLQPGPERRRLPLPWLLACAPALGATGAGLVLDRTMSVAGLAMVYVACVAAAACTLPRGPAALAALLCVTALNYFFIPPRRSLQVGGAEYWWVLACLLGLALGLHTLVGRYREQRAHAESARERAAQLHALAEALAAAGTHPLMAQAAASFLHQATGAPCAVYLFAQGAAPATRWATPPDAIYQERPARWAVEHGRMLGRGCLDWPELALWCAPFARQGAGGAVQLLLPGTQVPAADTLAHWQALARQVGLSIERERTAAQADQAAQAAEAEAVRNTLLASLSHDLRTPLAGILGSASALRVQGDAMAPAQRDRLLAALEEEAQDMAAMADNILQVARLSQPQSQLRLEWESVEDILAAAVARMRRRWPQAAIQLRAPPGLPPVRAEAGLLAQAVGNLVDNAVRHGGAPPRIVVQAGRSRQGVFIAVRDQGAGLPEGVVEHLFTPWQSRGTGAGTGLGLTICKLTAQAHGGSVTAVRCEPGTEFRIDLPAAAAPAERHGVVP